MADDYRVEKVTGLLDKWRQGDKGALNALIPHVYHELRRVARAQLRGERGDRAMQTTALVHEAYLRLVGVDRLTLTDRVHFFAVAARLMREILVDHARRHTADKRGGGVTVLTLDASIPAPASNNAIDILSLDAALDDLASLEPRLCQVVEMRFFAGLTIAEAAAALDVSHATVERDWVVARAWLHDRLSS